MSGPETQRLRGVVLTTLLGAGALAVVLASTRSPLFDLDRYAVPKELALHLTALVGLMVLLPGWRWLEATVVEFLLGIYVIWSGMAALLGQNHWLAFRGWSLTFASLVVFVMARAARRAGYGRVLLHGLALSVTVAALGGLLQAYGVEWAILQSDRPPGGTMGNRNFLAHLCVIGLPLAGFVAIDAPRRWLMWAGISALGILSWTILLTRSRAAWLAALLLLGTALVASWRLPAMGKRRRKRAAGLALVAGGLAAALLPNRLEWRAPAPYRESLTGLLNYQGGSGRGRLIQYRNSLKLIGRNPVFGTGPGNWMVEYPRVTTPGDPSFAGADPIPTNPWPSSDWVAIVSERGVIGTLLLAAAGVAAAVIAFRRRRHPEEGTAAVALIGLLIATVVTGLFDAVIHLAPPAFIIFAALGVLLPDTGVVLTREVTGRRRVAAVGLPLLAAAVATLYSGGQLAAIRITEIGRQRTAMERAVQYDPGNHRLHLLLAMRGNCTQRMPHARAAAELLPYHHYPRQMIRRCR